MGSIKTLAIATTVGLVGTIASAQAADIAIEPPMIEPLPPIEFGGWYLRGYIGMTNQEVDEVHNILMDDAADFEWLDEGDFDSGILFGGGLGYQFNPWFRVDLTGEYRGKTDFSALDAYDGGSNDYSARKSEWLVLANAYVDLGSWHGITPYLGAGIGAARNTIHDFRDINVPVGGVAYAGSDSTWNFAWALHAGVGYEVTENLTLDLAYRYVDLGDARTGDVRPYDGPGEIDNPTYFNDITSHDILFGLRWNFGHRAYDDFGPIVAKN